MIIEISRKMIKKVSTQHFFKDPFKQASTKNKKDYMLSYFTLLRDKALINTHKIKVNSLEHPEQVARNKRIQIHSSFLDDKIDQFENECFASLDELPPWTYSLRRERVKDSEAWQKFEKAFEEMVTEINRIMIMQRMLFIEIE